MPTFQEKKSRQKPSPATNRPEETKRDANLDVSIEDRGYDPYDVAPRDEAERRRQRDKWSF